MARRGYRGYVTHREFGGHRIPATIQNLILRDYCSKNSLVFRLSVNEYVFPNCFLQFQNILNELDMLEGVVMASFFMLPPDRRKREKIFKTVFDSGTSLHFAMENRAIREPSDVSELELIFSVHENLSRCPKEVPLEHLESNSVLTEMRKMSRFCS